MNDEAETVLGCFGAIVLLILIILIWYPLMYFSGWLIGWLIKFTIGDIIVRGVTAFGIALTADQIPTMCGILNIVGSFFRSTVERSKD